MNYLSLSNRFGNGKHSNATTVKWRHDGYILMSIGLGGKLAGILAQSAASAENSTINQLEHIYRNSFMIYCSFSMFILSYA